MFVDHDWIIFSPELNKSYGDEYQVFELISRIWPSYMARTVGQHGLALRWAGITPLCTLSLLFF